MMFGTRDEFDYAECGKCGTIQIVNIPELGPYYPPDYLAFHGEDPLRKNFLFRMAARRAGRFIVYGDDLIGRLIVKALPQIAAAFEPSVRQPPLSLNFDSRILDFGGGSGRLLLALRAFGFRDLTGADAFISGDIHYPSGVSVYKKGLREFESEFDLIMLHHSFEHLPDPNETLSEIRRLLSPGGYCLIRIPVVNFAWEKYGVNWVQMDPPRHLFLYTEEALRSLVTAAGFEVVKVQYDSTSFQFWGSEQYRLDIPLFGEKESNGFAPIERFTAAQLRSWDAEAAALNTTGGGDAACFYIRPV